MPSVWISSHYWCALYEYRIFILSCVKIVHIKYGMILISPLTVVFLISSFLFCVILFSVRLCEHYIFEFWSFPPNYESLSFNGIIWSIHIILQGTTFGKVSLLFSQTILPKFLHKNFPKFMGKLIKLFAHKLLLYLHILHMIEDILKCDSQGLLILFFSCLLIHLLEMNTYCAWVLYYVLGDVCERGWFVPSLNLHWKHKRDIQEIKRI